MVHFSTIAPEYIFYISNVLVFVMIGSCIYNVHVIKLLSLCGHYAEMFLAAVFSLSTLYDVTIYISTFLSQGSIKLTSKQMEMLKVEKTGELLRHMKGFITWPLYMYLSDANLWLVFY